MVPIEELVVKKDMFVRESELEYRYSRASGPGGQNVNKVETAVQLRFDVSNSSSLTDEMRERLLQIAHNRMTADGILIIESRSHRTQEQNRQEVLDRFMMLLRRAAEKPIERKQTRPTGAAKRRRLEGKRRRAEVKRLRAWRADLPD